MPNPSIHLCFLSLSAHRGTQDSWRAGTHRLDLLHTSLAVNFKVHVRILFQVFVLVSLADIRMLFVAIREIT